MLYLHLQEQIFARYQVDTARFQRSYRFYAAHPVMMEKVYEQVVDSLKTGQLKKPSDAQ